MEKMTGSIKTNDSLWHRVISNKEMLAMYIPGIIFLLLFNYYPMYGALIAFKDFNFSLGILGSPWVGLKYFEKAFGDPTFLQALRNTFVITSLKLVADLFASIVFAILLNETPGRRFRKVIQTVSFLPYFMSWVVLGSIFISIFSIDGVFASIVQLLGGTPKSYLADSFSFIVIVVVTYVWQHSGWGAVIIIAALAGVNQEMYEAAIVDGAGRWKRILYITLPSIIPVIVIKFILSISGILNGGLEQMYQMTNPAVINVGEILDTYVYKRGLQNMEYSYSAAVGLFKSVVGFVMVLITNKVANVFDKDSTLW